MYKMKVVEKLDSKMKRAEIVKKQREQAKELYLR